ncbi:MAG: hypothetical protein ACI9AD_001195, partial [Nitriliruptoraceae bacterium]
MSADGYGHPAHEPTTRGRSVEAVTKKRMMIFSGSAYPE